MSADDETIDAMQDDVWDEDPLEEEVADTVVARPVRASDARRRIDRYLEERRLREMLGEDDEWDDVAVLAGRGARRRARRPRLSG